MYAKNSRILHLGNVANTGPNLVRQARALGRDWAFRELPKSPSMLSPRAWLERGQDALRYSMSTVTPELAHVHYGPNGYYGDLKKAPFVLHLHGTDLREDLHRPLLGQLESVALRRASAVIVATPDLLSKASEIRPDARYVPNPVPPLSANPEALRQPREQLLPPGTVFFNARWDDSKGGTELVELAANVARSGAPTFGINWGTHAEAARRAGVELLPLTSPEEFREIQRQASVVVGQFRFGSLGISDLEALNAAKPLVGFVNTSLEGEVPLANSSLDTAWRAVSGLLEDETAASELGLRGQRWVQEHRSPTASVLALEETYRRVLNRKD